MPAKRAAIFLVAGQGKRMGHLTENHPKCLLSVGDITVLDTLLPGVLNDREREIVIVTGHRASAVEAWVTTRYPESQIRFVHNAEYITDVNILSVEKGVNALQFPERGYTIIETDILLDPRAWTVIREAESGAESFWLTHGRYSAALTGGIVEASGHFAKIGRIDYVPHYNAAFDGWLKMVGVLSVAATEVEADRALRREALTRGANQYYMVPWVQHRRQLPCIAIDISPWYARSFNSPAEYQHAVHDYQKLLQRAEVTENANSFS